MTIERIDYDAVHRGWATFSVARFRLADGSVLKREIEDHGTAAAVLAYDAERRVAMLVRQFRAPVFVAAGETELLETIAGMIEEADPKDAARREAREEAGLVLETLEPVATLWTMPGLSTERMALYLARYRARDRVEEGGGSAQESEQVEPMEIPLKELAADADSGRLADMKTFALVQTLRLRKPELFG
jgi:nudix-type nucleoside diphosphatase (YffH/AdpP family)